jgi:iron complex transport system substrate-binding protein
MTAGSGTAIGALIEAGGGRNLAAELGLHGIVPIGAERAFAADPDVVLTGSGTGTPAELRAHPLLSGLRALREGRLVEMPPELIVALSQHAADAAWDLAHRLHPDRVGTPRP